MSDPADINDRLEAAAVKAEGASEIMRRFSNDPAGTYITTESGQLPSLAEWLEINEEALSDVPGLTARVVEIEKSPVCATIAALKALDKTKNIRAFVIGYYAAGDGGGGAYYLDAADTTTADNGGTVIVATDGGRWKLAHKGVLSVRQFGVVGDGVTDETVKFQNAINTTYGKRLVVPPGCRIKITSSINILSKITIDFSERRGEIVVGSPNINAIVIGDGSGPVRDSLYNTQLLWPAFSPAPGVAQSTSGASIKRNFVAFVDVIGPSFYGADAGVRKLYRGLHDVRTSECEAPYIVSQEMHGDAHVYVEGTAGIANRAVDCNYDFARLYNGDGKGIYFGTDTAGLGVYRPTMFGNAGWGIHINATAGPSGQNYFIDTPDIEVGAASAGAIWLQSGSAAIIRAGWLGAGSPPSGTMRIGIQMDATFDTAEIDIGAVYGLRHIINGLACTIGGGNYSSDATTAGACFTIGGADCKIGDGVTIRQYAGTGIAWSGTPLRVQIGDVKFKDNGTDIAALTGYSALFAPVIGRCQSNKSRAYSSAATVNIPLSINVAQITGGTTITNIPASGVGSTLLIQAGAGGITLGSGGNLSLKSPPVAVPAFATFKLESDGLTWFETGRNF